MADKKSFVLYWDNWEMIEELSIEQRGILMTAIYALDNEDVDVPEMDQPTRLVFKMIRSQIRRDTTKYEETLEKRKKAGSKGGKASWEKRRSKTIENSTDSKQTEANAYFAEANEADNVNVNVNVNDNDNDNVIVNVNDNVSPCGSEDGQTEDGSFSTLGVNQNVKLTQDELNEVRSRYLKSSDLIDKVSLWLVKAKHPEQDHLQLIHTFALNDNWPKKPREKPPDPEPEPDPSRGPVMGMPDDVREKVDKLFS